MRSKTLLTTTAVAAVLVLAQAAQAHPGHGNGGLAAGVQHPLAGLDHLLAILAVGLFAGHRGGRSIWLMPLTFVTCMLAGGLLGIGHATAPAMEQAIAASVIVLGLLVASGPKVATTLALPLVALFAAFHGYAHGAELPAGASAISYAAGFALTTSVLLATGALIGALATRRSLVHQLTGAAIAATGVLLLCM